MSFPWMKASKAFKKEDQIYDQRIAEMAKRYSSEAFYALDDPSRGSRVFGTGAVI